MVRRATTSRPRTDPATAPAERAPTVTELRRVRVVLGLTLFVGGVAATLTILHAPEWFNGPPYHDWWWRRLSAWPLVPLMGLAAAPAVVAQVLFHRTGRTRWPLALLVVATVALQWAAVSPQPASPGRGRVEEIVDHGINTSYYSAATVLVAQQEQGVSVREWMAIYPELQEHYLMLHAKYKPPGLVLYYMLWVELLGPTVAARLAGAAGVSLLAGLGTVSTYWLIRTFTADRATPFHAATYFALIPSLICFFPQFDQAYVPLAAGMLILWTLALRTGRTGYALGFGGLLALVLFVSHAFLMLGAFLSLYTLLHIHDHGTAGLKTAVRQSAVVVAVVVGSYGALRLLLDFDAVAVFLTANRLSQAHLVELQRPFPLHQLYDVYDVVLGMGWIAVPLIAAGVARLFSDRATDPVVWRFAVLGLAQVALSIGVAVFPGENARLLLFVMPLLMVGIGAELARWPLRYRIAVFVMLAVLTTLANQNMTFLRMPIDGP